MSNQSSEQTDTVQKNNITIPIEDESKLSRETSISLSSHTSITPLHNYRHKPDEWWQQLSLVLTCCIPTFILKHYKPDLQTRQAFREKLTLCIIILFITTAVGFLTFGFSQTICLPPPLQIHPADAASAGYVKVFGYAYEIPQKTPHPKLRAEMFELTSGRTPDLNLDVFGMVFGKDAGFLFQKPHQFHACSKFDRFDGVPCKLPGFNVSLRDDKWCHDMTNPTKYFSSMLKFVGVISYNWTEIRTTGSENNLIVYNNAVLDLTRLPSLSPYLPFLSLPQLQSILSKHHGKDATHALISKNFKSHAECLQDIFKIGTVESTSIGCITANFFLYVSLAMVVGIVAVRFVFAVTFAMLIGWKLGDKNTRTGAEIQMRKAERKATLTSMRNNRSLGRQKMPTSLPPPLEIESKPKTDSEVQIDRSERTSDIDATVTTDEDTINVISSNEYSTPPRRGMNSIQVTPTRLVNSPEQLIDLRQEQQQIDSDPEISDPTRLHTIIMVPCYSEDSASMKKTLDSVAHAYYPATHKVIIVVADGIVKGHGNTKTTPEILIDLMEVDQRFSHEDPRIGNVPEFHSYDSIGEGSLEVNCARVYAGWYKYDENGKKCKEKRVSSGMGVAGLTASWRKNALTAKGTIKKRKEGRVPMLVVIKCGNDEEREGSVAKPGNRGKRDSQLLLMKFLTKVTFDEAMSELEFDLFYKLWVITGVHPDRYQSVMFIDADTEIYPDSITHMIACLLNDKNIMGLCGETRIANKWESWVTMIQVFEYYISHHLSKAFESVFGGVTCLPGCFSMYRIKTPTQTGDWIPILANPNIVEEYSENEVDTLHKKNLLLLGEDRLLTTLMLRTFPRRSMIFVPAAICKTVVPANFNVLLSQRRRWINSTIHNLLELLLVKDLCGSFCCSMQTRRVHTKTEEEEDDDGGNGTSKIRRMKTVKYLRWEEWMRKRGGITFDETKPEWLDAEYVQQYLLLKDPSK
ncbi:Chitin synthase, class 3 [Nowakowskiella sp. JEL0407]|nr:Chitin synthase, class 3 [Nowakowskiella sp. JEL0407]